MNVEDAIGKCFEQPRSDQPHISGKANQIDTPRAKDLDDGAIVRVAIGVVRRIKMYGLDAGVAGPRKARGIRAIGHNDRDLSIEPSSGNRVEDRLQVAAASRDQNGNSCHPVSGTFFNFCDT